MQLRMRSGKKDLPLAVVGRGGALLGVNQAFAAALETDASDLCRADLFDFTHPVDVAWARPLNLALFANIGPALAVRDVAVPQYRLRGKSGRIVKARIAIRCFPPPADSRGPIYNIGVVLPDGRDPSPGDLERHFATPPSLAPGLVEVPAKVIQPPSAATIVAQVTVRSGKDGSHPGNAPTSSGGRLSTRELEVIALVGAGLRNAEIARALFISEDAIKKRLRSIFHKLGLRDRVAVALYAARNGIQ
jgi:DNA-binding CsgD family transcriptional regulator